MYVGLLIMLLFQCPINTALTPFFQTPSGSWSHRGGALFMDHGFQYLDDWKGMYACEDFRQLSNSDVTHCITR